MTPTKRGHNPAPNPGPGATERKVYVVRDGWLDLLAGGDPRWLNRAGEPAATLISTAAGLDRTALTQLKNGDKGLGPHVMGALVGFMQDQHGYSRERAEAELFDHIPYSEAQARAGKEVAA